MIYYCSLTFVVQRRIVRYLAVWILRPCLEDREATAIDLAQTVQTRLHTGSHATRVASSERDLRIRIQYKFIRKAKGVSQDVVEDRPADISLRPIRVAVAQ